MQAAIESEKHRLKVQERLDIDYRAVTDAELERQKSRVGPRGDSQPDPGNEFVSRITVTSQDDRTYRFGAITESAAIPEREIVIDSSLVDQVNKGLPAARDLDAQREEGQVLERLLVPEDLRGQIYSSAPLVLMLNASMARIHWEMIVQGSRSTGDPREEFIGTSRGVTRQLQTVFSQSPEPTPPPRRIMRVLIIADPAGDNPLRGAQEEGIALERLFKQFNIVHEGSGNRIEVESMFGPQEATRKNVMKALLLHTYDVLHFAGHVKYVEEAPDRSGWVFTGNELITASELNRIDRIPNFIFSNACESGVTPDRAEKRTVALGPTFAEAFFQRGVKNFVCTAWPVDDFVARDFAVRLYERLLGLKAVESTPRPSYRTVEPAQMHWAMRDTRFEVSKLPRGLRSWGAYQHYGNPFMRFFDPSRMSISDA